MCASRQLPSEALQAALPPELQTLLQLADKPALVASVHRATELSDARQEGRLWPDRDQHAGAVRRIASATSMLQLKFFGFVQPVQLVNEVESGRKEARGVCARLALPSLALDSGRARRGPWQQHPPHQPSKLEGPQSKRLLAFQGRWWRCSCSISRTSRPWANKAQEVLYL